MNAAARDTRLPLQARAIAFWILENPSEIIDPEAIAKANELAVSYVRKLLAKLAELGHLIAPQKIRGEKGRFHYTPYMLPPQDKITSTVEEPARSEAPHGQNNQSGQDTVTDEKTTGISGTNQHEISTPEYVRAGGDVRAPVFVSVSQKEKDRQTDYKPVDQSDQGDTGSVRQEILIDAEKARELFHQYIGLMNADIAAELTGHVAFYGIEPVMVMISNASTRQRKEGLRDPMSYIRQGLSRMALEGNVPKLSGPKPTPAPAAYSPTTSVPSVAPAPAKVHPKQISQPVSTEVVKVDPEGFKRKILERRERERSKDYVPGNNV